MRVYVGDQARPYTIFEQLEISFTRSIYRQVVGRCKTEISRKPVPLDLRIAEELLTWKRATPYSQPEDWGFAVHG